MKKESKALHVLGQGFIQYHLTQPKGLGIMMVTEPNEINKQTRWLQMSEKTKKQKQKVLRRRAITLQNNSTSKKTMAQAIKEVSDVSNDV